MSKETTSAYSLDIDGVLVKRPPLQLGAAKLRRLLGLAMYDRQLALAPIERKTEEKKISSLKEAISFHLHSGRGIRKEIIERLNQRNDVDMFGNTGRSNKQRWVELTRRQLNGSGLTNLRDIFFTPEGHKTVDSKGAAIQELLKKYKYVTHFDDDPLTILLLAKQFPEVDFVLVEDLSANYLLKGVNWSQYHNVRRVKNIQEL